MVQLTAWLCLKFGLDENDVIRHYDVTGKNCPKYFVENQEAWDQFRADVGGGHRTDLEALCLFILAFSRIKGLTFFARWI